MAASTSRLSAAFAPLRKSPNSPAFLRRLSSSPNFLSPDGDQTPVGNSETPTPSSYGLRRHHISVSEDGPAGSQTTCARRKISMEFSCSRACSALVQSPCRGQAYRSQRRKLYHQDSPPSDPPATHPRIRTAFLLGGEDDDADTVSALRLPSDSGESDAPDADADFEETPLRSRAASLPSIIGRGGFGSVFMGKYNRERAAIKELFSRSTKEGPDGSSLMRELNAFRLSHPNIIRILTFTVPQRDTIQIVYEYVGARNLQQVIDDSKQLLSTADVCCIASQIACALAYCHLMMVVHLDVKAGNVLVADSPRRQLLSTSSDVGAASEGPAWRLKLADFGCSRRLPAAEGAGAGGTATHMGPELLRGRAPTTKADVFSFAVLLWELVTRERPYAGLHPQTIIFLVVSQGLRPKSTGPLAPSARRLVQMASQCWAAEPELRPDFQWVLARLADF